MDKKEKQFRNQGELRNKAVSLLSILRQAMLLIF